MDIVKTPPHYTQWEIEPVEFIMKNKIPYAEANVIKYVCRYKKKGGVIDLKKAKQYIDILIQYEYGEEHLID